MHFVLLTKRVDREGAHSHGHTQRAKETVNMSDSAGARMCAVHTDVKLLDVTIILRSNNMLRRH